MGNVTCVVAKNRNTYIARGIAVVAGRPVVMDEEASLSQH